MKLVDVSEFFAERGGGVKSYCHQKLKAGSAAGHEIVIVAPGPVDGEEERLGGRIIWVKGPPLPLDPRYYVLWNERAVHRILDRERPDVVEGSSPWSGGWFAGRWQGKAVKSFVFHQDPVAVWGESMLDRFVSRDGINRGLFGFWRYLRMLSERFDITLTSGNWLAEKLSKHGLKAPHAVSFGIDKKRFSPDKASASRRAELLASCGLGPDAKLLVTVSRMHPEKRLHTVLEAFRLASKQRPMGLVIYGDGPFRTMVERHARRIPHVHMAGYTASPEDLPIAYASADLMLHGSAAETYGLVIAEAMCSGLPLVVPDVGGAADLVDPQCAQTYPPGDARKGAAAILAMLDRDPADTRKAALKAAVERIGTMEDHFEQLFALYGRLAG